MDLETLFAPRAMRQVSPAKRRRVMKRIKACSVRYAEASSPPSDQRRNPSGPDGPVAPGPVVMSKRHDDHDAADVQDGPEHEVSGVVQSPAVSILLGGQTAQFSIGGKLSVTPQVDI
jgi:hypothetical protein